MSDGREKLRKRARRVIAEIEGCSQWGSGGIRSVRYVDLLRWPCCGKKTSDEIWKWLDHPVAPVEDMGFWKARAEAAEARLTNADQQAQALMRQGLVLQEEITTLRGRLAVAMEALEPFAEAAEHLHPTSPDDGLTLDGVEVKHWRQAWWVFNNPGEGKL